MAYDKLWFATLCLVSSSVVAVVANLLLVIVFCRRRGLRTVSNRFVINLLVTNLLSSILIIPLLIVDQGSTQSVETLDFQNATTLTVENITVLQDGDLFVEKEKFVDEQQVQELSENESGFLNKEKIYGEEVEQKEILVKDDMVISSDGGELKVISHNKDVYKDFFNLTINYNSQRLNTFLCHFSQSSTSLVCTASIFSILLIGIDQYFAVLHSLRYHSYIDKFRSLILIIASWTISILFACLGTLTHEEFSVWGFCQINNQKVTRASTLGIIYAFSYFTVVILVPFIAICIIYVCIYTAAHKNSERMRKSTSSQGSTGNFEKYTELPSTEIVKLATKSLPKVQSAPTFVTFGQLESEFNQKNTENVKFEIKNESSDESEVVPPQPRKEVTYVIPPEVSHSNSNSNNTNCVLTGELNGEITGENGERVRKISRACSERVATTLFNSLKYKISNASIFRYREESRAAKISILVIFMVLICYIPYGLAIAFNTKVFPVELPSFFNYASLILLVTSNVVSPFLFAYRNKRIQRELFKFCGVVSSKVPTSHQNSPRRSSTVNRIENNAFERVVDAEQPFLPKGSVPRVIIDVIPEKKSILKRVCSKNWPNYKNCNFITVPDSCLSGDARGSFSSASTQISTED